MLDTSQPEADAVSSAAPQSAGSDADALAELRHQRLVAFTGCFLVFALVALLMPAPFHGRLWDRLADLLHIPAFGLINYLALSITRYHFVSRWRVPLMVTAAVILFSGLIELVQGMLSRYASLSDLFCNSMGATTALLLHQIRYAAPSANIRWGLLSIAVLVITLGTFSPVSALFDMYLQRRQFPVLASFRTSAELQRWYINSADVQLGMASWFAAQPSLRVTFFPGELPVVKLQHLQRNWTGHETFVTELTHSPASKSEVVKLQLQITDIANNWKRGDRYSEWIEIERGQTHRIHLDLETIGRSPRDRQLRLDAIAAVEFRAFELSEPATIEISTIRLEGTTNSAGKPVSAESLSGFVPISCSRSLRASAK